MIDDSCGRFGVPSPQDLEGSVKQVRILPCPTFNKVTQ